MGKFLGLLLLLQFQSGAVCAAIQFYPEWKPHRDSAAPGLVPPERPVEVKFNDRIFDDQLVQELRDRYQERFGPIELAYLSPDLPDIDVIQIKSLELTERDTVVEENEQLKRYGAFVARRLSEFQLDKNLRRNRRSRPIYETKERFTNARVKIVGGASLRARYNISGNYVEVRLKSPWFETWVTVDYGPGASFGVEEIIYSCQSEIYDRWILESSFRQRAGLLFVGARKRLTPALVATFRISRHVEPNPDPTVEDYEDLFLAGLAYKY